MDKKPIELYGRITFSDRETSAYEIHRALRSVNAIFTPDPKRGARVKAPVRTLHRAPIWPERAS